MQASRECRIRDAITHFQAAAEADPSNAKVLALLSKQWTDLTYAHGAVVEVKHAHHCNTKALEYAEAAVAADPRCMSARVACCVSKGRLALFVSDARAKVSPVQRFEVGFKRPGSPGLQVCASAGQLAGLPLYCSAPKCWTH